MTRTRLVAVVASLALIGVLPADAGAASVQTMPFGTGVQLVYAAEPGEANVLAISQDADGYLLTDSGAEITPAGACTNPVAADAHTARCSAGSVRMIEIAVDDGADRLTIADSAAPPQAPDSFPIHADGGEGGDTLTRAQFAESRGVQPRELLFDESERLGVVVVQQAKERVALFDHRR